MIKNKKLLILNGSHSEIPLIKSAKSLGFYVITTGNNPKLIGHQYSDERCFADFSNPDAILDPRKASPPAAIVGPTTCAALPIIPGYPGMDG